mmetsp:Transcript_15845/g.23185  ORF Transcript_15845/g.23185 Transcript_15845/m.23185 type:complete len:154 (+) Transcript_15845:105-566(+)
MTDPITSFVKKLSWATANVNTQFSTFAKLSQNRTHFPKVAAAVTLFSGLFGYGIMQIVDRRRESNLKVYEEQQNRSQIITENESLVRAMIENAKSSTPRENLENAAMAQKNFMLLPFDSSVVNESEDQKFLQKIVQRGEEIRDTSADGRGRPT